MTTLIKVPTVDLSAMSVAELRAELARGLAMTAAGLTRLALIWRELEDRGENLDDLRTGMARNLPLIAAGRLAAEAVVAFAGKPSILRALEGFPLERQRAFAAGEPVNVIDPADPTATTPTPLAQLPAAVVRIVLGEGVVRTPAEQRMAFRPRRKRAEDSGRRYQPRYDREAGTITVGKMVVRLADLLDALHAAAGPDHPPGDAPEDYLTTKVRLSKIEHDRFLAACRKAGLPEWEMARKALRAFGLI